MGLCSTIQIDLLSLARKAQEVVHFLCLIWQHYQYRHDRARCTLHGIDEQVKKAQLAVDGKASVKRNRFIALDGATKSVNRELEARARALAGIKG